ncbi:MAG: porin [Alphaproteobacteria bacterium]|nr:porin [Alphaproteobacteria bacterium]
MRKILLATTAIVGFVVAGAAQAATTPLNVTIGGDADFVAGAFHESKASTGANQAHGDFETLYDLNFGIDGKAGNGVEYGGNLSLNNNPDISNMFNGTSDGIEVTDANVFMSGAFGKVVLGDSHGATDLAVTAPTVGEGQVNGRYVDFLNTQTFAKTFVYGVDGTDHSTNVTYFTPKVGNDMNKVQLGVSYIPNFYDYGSSVVQTRALNTSTTVASPYGNVVKGALAYTGTFHPVSVGVSADVITGSANTGYDGQSWLSGIGTNAASGAKVRDFTAFDFGAKAAAQGFTLGATYSDQGHYNTVAGQTKQQQQYGAALKYEFSKVGVGVSYLGGEGYDNMLTTGGTSTSGYDYISEFNSYGVGGTYAWAPGLTTNADAVLFDQKTESSVKNDGYVLLISQKLAF